MDITQFRQLFDRKVVEKPKLFELISPDTPANERQLSDAEYKLGVKLPSSYRSFLIEFGGGSFGLTNVFSVDPESDYFLVSRNSQAHGLLPNHLIAFSDDFSGGWYAFATLDGTAGDSVFYWNVDGGLQETRFMNVFEYVAHFAFDSA
jgi:hypothetical protein